MKNTTHSGITIGTSTSNNGRVGGIVGYIGAAGSLTISGITHDGKVSGERSVGGIIGEIIGEVRGNDITVKNTDIAHDNNFNNYYGFVIGLAANATVDLTGINATEADSSSEYVGRNSGSTIENLD